MKRYVFKKALSGACLDSGVQEHVDDDDPFGNAEDMESVDYSDDELNLPMPCSVRVHGPSKLLSSELYADSDSDPDDETFNVHPNEARVSGPNKSGIGAVARPNSAVDGEMIPGISLVLDPACCNH